MKTLLAIAAIYTTVFLYTFNANAAVAGGTLIQLDSEKSMSIEKLFDERKEIQIIAEGSIADSIQLKQVNVRDVFSAQGRIFMFDIIFGKDSELLVTGDHTILLADGHLVLAKDLKPGDKLMSKDGTAVEVHAIRYGEYDGLVDDIDLSSSKVTESLYIANGIYVGSFELSLKFAQDSNLQPFQGQDL